MNTITVELCLGSSCFARGNSEALSVLETYIKDHHLEDKVKLVGHLCDNACSIGPNVTIDGIQYHGVQGDVMIDLLESALEKKAKEKQP
jgi:NADH:ubiquinone oxidoreductase subunit E